MPHFKSPSSLKWTCFTNIVKHIDTYWCADYLEHFHDNRDDNKIRVMYVVGPFDDLRE